jgi:hypothetical protein
VTRLLRFVAGTTLALAFALLPAAVGGATNSGLYGVVTAGPTKPVCQVGVPCDAPVRVTLVFSQDGAVVAHAQASPKGRYRIALAPGYYGVRSLKRIGVGRLPRPHAVHIRSGHWDRIDLRFDTGIR